MLNTLSQRKRILVIDDNPAIFSDFQKVLKPPHNITKELSALSQELFGESESIREELSEYEIDFAPRGQEGVAKIELAVSELAPYAIAFVDMRMPNGWDGLETIKHIWKKDPKIQIILCTAYSDYSWEEIRAELSHRDRFLILKKPFDAIEVQQMVETLFSRQQAESLLNQSNTLLQNAQSIAKIGHYTFDPKSQLIERSHSLNHLFEIPEGYGDTFDDFIKIFASESATNFKKALEISAVDNEPFEIVAQLFKGNGQIASVITAGYWTYDQEMNAVRLIGTIQDITHSYELQNQLGLLDAFVSQSNEIVIITNNATKTSGGPRIVYVNQLFEEKIGYSANFAIGKTIDILFGDHTQNLGIDKIEKSILNFKSLKTEIILYNKNKEAIWMELELSPIQNQDPIQNPNSNHFIYQLRDISKQKNTLNTLTPKEFNIVKAVAENSEITLKEVAGNLFISENTLRNHLTSIYEKLGLRSRLELYIFCNQFINELENKQE